MAVKIENEKLFVTINEHGAELASLINKSNGMNYLWSGDSKYWGRKSPVLFPIEGALKDGKMFVDGKEYRMGQHGFARDMDFEVKKLTKESACFELKSNTETQEKYPYDFIFRLIYELKEETLVVKYEVENPSDGEMFFGLGAHPAFSVPLGEVAYDDYYLEITPEKARKVLPLKGGLVDNINTIDGESKLEISHDLFAKDAIIYDLGEEPTKFSLRNTKNNYGVEVFTPNSKFAGIWSSYPAKGQFVCIEPWWSLADTVYTDGNFKEKFATNKLNGKESFDAYFEITVF